MSKNKHTPNPMAHAITNVMEAVKVAASNKVLDYLTNSMNIPVVPVVAGLAALRGQLLAAGFNAIAVEAVLSALSVSAYKRGIDQGLGKFIGPDLENVLNALVPGNGKAPEAPASKPSVVGTNVGEKLAQAASNKPAPAPEASGGAVRVQCDSCGKPIVTNSTIPKVALFDYKNIEGLAVPEGFTPPKGILDMQGKSLCVNSCYPATVALLHDEIDAWREANDPNAKARFEAHTKVEKNRAIRAEMDASIKELEAAILGAENIIKNLDTMGNGSAIEAAKAGAQAEKDALELTLAELSEKRDEHDANAAIDESNYKTLLGGKPAQAPSVKVVAPAPPKAASSQDDKLRQAVENRKNKKNKKNKGR